MTNRAEKRIIALTSLAVVLSIVLAEPIKNAVEEQLQGVTGIGVLVVYGVTIFILWVIVMFIMLAFMKIIVKE